MIKGCRRKVVMVKSPNSEIFEEAYFILKEENEDGHSEYDIVKEADRLLSECREKGREKEKKKISFGEVVCFLTGVVITSVFWGILSLFV